MKEIPSEMQRLYKQAKELIKSSDDIKIYSHIDCDGMSAGAILSIILDRINKPHEIDFVNLDVLNDLEIKNELTIFSDLGSGQHVYKYARKNDKILILDHHLPLKGRYIDHDKITFLEINPNNYEKDSGSDKICGGGLCYLLAKEFGFTDLSWIGVLSAVGDMQNSKEGKLIGWNENILQDAMDEGYVQLNEGDLNFYGRNSRPIYVALSYFSDVKLPITNNQNETLALLSQLGIPKYIFQIDKLLNELDIQYEQRISLLNQEKKDKLFNKLVQLFQDTFKTSLAYDNIKELLRSLKINTTDKVHNIFLDSGIFKEDLEINQYTLDIILNQLNSGDKKRLLRKLLAMQREKLETDYNINNEKTITYLLLQLNFKKSPTKLNDLTHEEKAKLYNEFHSMLTTALPAAYGKYISKLLIQDNYDFLMEEEYSPLRDAAEFSTAMNACGRNKEYNIALEILKGNREKALDDLKTVSNNHKYNLANSISKVTDKREIIELENLQYFETDDIKPEIIGTVTGMILGYCNWKKPILGLSVNSDIGYKVSLRCSRLLAYSGIHFGHIIREVSEEVGGSGGGHAVACGAYIPLDKKNEFINNFNKRIEGLVKTD